MKPVETVYKAFLADCQSKNLQRRLINVAPRPGGRLEVGGKTYINVASNDYLGLTFHPLIGERSREMAARYGNGAGASRLVTGNYSAYQQVEAKIAALKGKEAALVLASGYQANGAILEALFQKAVLKTEPLVVTDRLNHASMHFGCAAAGVRQKRYRHLDAAHAEEHLAAGAEETPRFLLTETVFSMDGDIAPMGKLADICQKQNALLIADDAHGFGVWGERGEGLSGKADVVIGTFSKASGAFGAYVAASQTIIDYLIQRCGGLIYSTALPPATLGAISAGLDLIPEMKEERQRVLAHADQFRTAMQGLGLNTGASASQIVPLIVGGAEAALAMQAALREKGYWVTAIRPPTVPEGTARLRFAFSASLSEADIKGLISAIKEHLAADTSKGANS